MSDKRDVSLVKEAYERALGCNDRLAMAAILSHTRLIFSVVLFAAANSAGFCADPQPLVKHLRLPVVDGNDIRFTRLQPVQGQLQTIRDSCGLALRTA